MDSIKKLKLFERALSPVRYAAYHMHENSIETHSICSEKYETHIRVLAYITVTYAHLQSTYSDLQWPTHIFKFKGIGSYVIESLKLWFGSQIWFWPLSDRLLLIKRKTYRRKESKLKRSFFSCGLRTECQTISHHKVTWVKKRPTKTVYATKKKSYSAPNKLI